MFYSVCEGNLELRSIAPISVSWKTSFLNLFFDREKAREKHFADNGKNWQYSDTDYSFKTTLLDVYLDDNDHIVDVTMYKYQSTSFNHGKNSSKELKVTTADITKYLAVLSEVVEENAEEETEKVLSSFQQSDLGKDRKLQISKNDFTVLDSNNHELKIKKKTLMKALQLSRKYLEIFHDDSVFTDCPKEFPPDSWSVLHELLSFVNTENYYHIDDLKYQMEMRKLIALAEEKYPQLRQAVIDGNYVSVTELASFAKLVPQENPEGAPLFHAVKGNRIDLAKALLENGAYAIEMAKDGSRFPLEVAYQNENRDMICLLVGYHGAKVKTYSVSKHNTDGFLKACAANKDYDVLKLLPAEAFSIDPRTWLAPEMFPDMNDDTVRSISDCDSIRMAWELDQIKPVYEQKDRELCKKMLHQGSTKQVVEFFIAENDFEMFELLLSD